MGFADAVKSALGQYAGFSGRARRSEFWWFYLAVLLLAFVAGGTDAAVVLSGILVLVISLALALPLLAVSARRLHDTGRSAWWLLLSFVPFVGIALLVFWCMDSTPEPNSHGPSPKDTGLPVAAYS